MPDAGQPRSICTATALLHRYGFVSRANVNDTLVMPEWGEERAAIRLNLLADLVRACVCLRLRLLRLPLSHCTRGDSGAHWDERGTGEASGVGASAAAIPRPLLPLPCCRRRRRRCCCHRFPPSLIPAAVDTSDLSQVMTELVDKCESEEQRARYTSVLVSMPQKGGSAVKEGDNPSDFSPAGMRRENESAR